MYKVNSNFMTWNPNLECQLGSGEKEENQQHILVYEKILEKMPYKIEHTNYNYIFGSQEEQKSIIGIFTDMTNVREALLEKV